MLKSYLFRSPVPRKRKDKNWIRLLTGITMASYYRIGYVDAGLGTNGELSSGRLSGVEVHRPPTPD